MHIASMIHTGGERTKGILRENSEEFPLVTVITAVYNGEKHLASCLDSVILQNYPNIEHIVIDGGSKDGTVSILRSYGDQLALWISEPDTGVYDAWNKGLDLASGEWIAFLGSDDEYLPGAISAYMALAQTSPDVDYLSSQIRWVHPAGYIRVIGEAWSWPRYSRVMCSIHVGSMHRRRLFEQYGRFDLSYKVTADYELLLRPRSKLRTAFLPEVTILMRAGGISDSERALHEAARAKIDTGGRSRIIGKLELRLAIWKYRLRGRLSRVLVLLGRRDIQKD